MHKPDSRSLLLRAAIALQLIPALAVADDAGAGAEGAGLEVITVTAQKVSEDLQKTGAAVTAISGDVLVSAGVYDIRGVQNLMPSVRFQAENASTEPVLATPRTPGFVRRACQRAGYQIDNILFTLPSISLIGYTKVLGLSIP